MRRFASAVFAAQIPSSRASGRCCTVKPEVTTDAPVVPEPSPTAAAGRTARLIAPAQQFFPSGGPVPFAVIRSLRHSDIQTEQDIDKLLRVFCNYLDAADRLRFLCTSSKPSVRMQARLYYKRHHPSHRVVEMIYERVQVAVEHRSVPLSSAARLFGQRWPKGLEKHHMSLKLHLQAWIVDCIHATLQYDAVHSMHNKKAVVRKVVMRKAVESESTRPDVLAQQESVTAHIPPPSNYLTPSDAKRILRSCCEGLRGRTEVIGPLATLAMRDLQTNTNADEILGVLWAVCDAKTGAPDAFWRASVNRLYTLHQQKLIPRDVTTVDAEVKGNRGLSNREIYRLIRLVKRERWCGEAAVLYSLAAHALSTVHKNFAQHPNSSFRVAPTGVVSRVRMRQRCLAVASLAPQELFSLIEASCELGFGFRQGVEEMGGALLAPLIKTFELKSLAMVGNVLKLTRCTEPTLYQALVDTLVARSGIDRAGSEDSTLRLGGQFIELVEMTLRLVALDGELCKQLKLTAFLALIQRVTNETRKFSPNFILSFTTDLYMLYRRIAPESTLAGTMRTSVDEFAFQLERMLRHGVVTVDLVGTFLQHTVTLRMRNSADTFPGTTKLLQTRSELYANFVAKKQISAASSALTGPVPLTPPFTGIVGHIGTHEVYQQLFHCATESGLYHHMLPAAQLNKLKKACVDYGIYATVCAAKIYRDLHMELPKEGRQLTPPIVPPPIVELQLVEAIFERVSNASLLLDGAKLQDAEVLRQALGMSAAMVSSPAIVEKFVVASLMTPLRPLQSNTAFWNLILAVACHFGTEEQQRAVKGKLDGA